ncbi:MAG: DUF58 domain-containing protein [Oceanobacter sp.]
MAVGRSASSLNSKTQPVSQLTDNLFSSGTQVEAVNLVQLSALAPRLPLRKQKKILNQMSGHHASNIRGRGIDYSEVRQYQPGDDIRTMDWRVTARTDSPHIKVFSEEKERPVLLVCDLRKGMQFATRKAFKSVVAADITALLGWCALSGGDRIGALLFNDESEIDLRPKTGRKQVLSLIRSLTEMSAASGTTNANANASQSSLPRMEQICRQLRQVARPGSAIYFVSDWQGYNEQAERQLYETLRHCDMTAIRIYDPLEQEPPPAGLYDLTDGLTRGVLNTATERARRAHQQAFMERQRALEKSLTRLRVPLIDIATSDDPLIRLRQGLGLNQNRKPSIGGKA